MRGWEVTYVSSEFGKLLRVSVFGQSHGRAIGVLIDGLPAGENIDLEELNAFLDRRKPGKTRSPPPEEKRIRPCFSPDWKTAPPAARRCAP